MSTLQRLKLYISITGATQKYIADNVNVSKTTINRWFNDKDNYIPNADIINKIDILIDTSIAKLNKL